MLFIILDKIIIKQTNKFDNCSGSKGADGAEGVAAVWLAVVALAVSCASVRGDCDAKFTLWPNVRINP